MQQKGNKGQAVLELIFLAPPALTGFLIHAPLFLTLRAVARAKTAGTVFFDSVLFGLLLLSYPLYYGLLLLLVGLLGSPALFYFFLAMPLWAWAYTMWKNARLNVFYSDRAD